MKITGKDVEIKLVGSVNDLVGNVFRVVEYRPAYEYVDGERTKNIIGYNYTVVAMERGWERFNVKVDGACAFSIPSEDIPNEGVEVMFEDLKERIWVKASGNFANYEISFTAAKLNRKKKLGEQ